jgi:hypothetical protein
MGKMKAVFVYSFTFSWLLVKSIGGKPKKLLFLNTAHLFCSLPFLHNIKQYSRQFDTNLCRNKKITSLLFIASGMAGQYSDDAEDVDLGKM